MVVIDFSGVQDNAIIPDGEYRVVLSKTEIRDTKDKQSQYIVFDAIIEDDEAVWLNGRHVFRNFSLKPTALWALKRALVAFEVDTDVLEGEVDIEEVAQELWGNAALARVRVVKDNNDPNIDRNEVTFAPLPF